MACACKVANKMQKKEYEFQKLHEGKQSITKTIMKWAWDILPIVCFRIIMSIIVMIFGIIVCLFVFVPLILTGHTTIHIPQKLIKSNFFKSF